MGAQHRLSCAGEAASALRAQQGRGETLGTFRASRRSGYARGLGLIYFPPFPALLEQKTKSQGTFADVIHCR